VGLGVKGEPLNREEDKSRSKGNMFRGRRRLKWGERVFLLPDVKKDEPKKKLKMPKKGTGTSQAKKNSKERGSNTLFEKKGSERKRSSTGESQRDAKGQHPRSGGSRWFFCINTPAGSKEKTGGKRGCY